MEKGKITMTDNSVRLELFEGTVWVTKSEIARLLDVFVQTVSANLREVFKNKELFEHEVVRQHCYTNDKGVECATELYNLDVVIALAFRMKGGRCRLFREWVREQIKRSIVKNHKPPIVIQLNGTAFLS